MNKLSIKLFVGCCLTPELRLHLFQSKQWKQASVSNDQPDLKIVHYQGKDFLGHYLPSENIILKELHLKEKSINQRIKHYCPEYLEDQKVCIFPHVFVE